jgi:hypothetical protein
MSGHGRGDAQKFVVEEVPGFSTKLVIMTKELTSKSAPARRKFI